MTNTNSGKQAVVLSGGGANGAYEVGVLKALCSGLSPVTGGQPLAPDIFTGTSVGSYNAAFLVSQWETYGSSAIANLEQVWLDKLSDSPHKSGNGVFRFRANPLEFINPLSFIPNLLQPFSQFANDSAFLAWQGLQRAVRLATRQEAPLFQRVTGLFDFSLFVSRQPLVQTLHETIRFADLRRAQKVLKIPVTNWGTGQVEIFSNSDMTDQFGPLIISASSAIPGFFLPTELGSQPCVDGAVLLNTPMKPAIDAEADILHVIYLDPVIRNIPFAATSNTLDTLSRMQAVGLAKGLQNDIALAKSINQQLAFTKLTLEALDILKQRASDANLFEGIPLGEIECYFRQYHEHYREVTIHLYHPYDDLGGGLGILNFDRHRIQQLIERGFDDAVDHHCDHSGCILLQ
jgi:predicted acylesterase/phospholipase RssA